MGHNILSVTIIPLMGWAIASQLLVNAGKKPLPGADRLLNPGLTLLLTVIFAFWFLRNLPFFPFNLLAP
jgi:hypothetical protein